LESKIAISAENRRKYKKNVEQRFSNGRQKLPGLGRALYFF